MLSIPCIGALDVILTRSLLFAEALCCLFAAFVGLEYDNPNRPEAANLLAIYSLVTGRSTVRPFQQRMHLLTRSSCRHQEGLQSVFLSGFHPTTMLSICKKSLLSLPHQIVA